ncbi:MAG TPA: hypothetical protein VMK65_07990, partial [Longimicrobiales bacterium]|nr:hypothetical protein [Longimicrobiales bacterium]
MPGSSASPAEEVAAAVGAAGVGAAPDPLYVTVLTTRQTRLDGGNPIVGLFRSSDGGLTWSHLGWEQGKAFAVVASAGGDTLVVAQGNGVHRSIDGGEGWRVLTGWRVTEVQDVALMGERLYAATPYGVWVSEDGGSAWAERSAGLETPDATFVSSVRVDRERPGRVLIGTEAGLFVSDDGGGRWRPLPLAGPVRSLRQSPHEARRWAAALEGRGAAVSEDGGLTWRVAGGLPAGTTFYELEWDPHEVGVLWGGGWRTGVLRSADLGASWQGRGAGLPDPSIHGLALPRGRPGVIFAGTLGEGLFRSGDG